MFHWPATEPNNTAVIACPYGPIGATATALCGVGRTLVINTTNCMTRVNNDLTHLVKV